MAWWSCWGFTGRFNSSNRGQKDGAAQVKDEKRKIKNGPMVHVNVDTAISPLLPRYVPSSTSIETGVGISSSPVSGIKSEKKLKQRGFTTQKFHLRSCLKNEDAHSGDKHSGGGVTSGKKLDKKVKFSTCTTERYFDANENLWVHKRIQKILRP